MSTQFAALTINVDASQVQVGDQLIWGGEPHELVAIKPYLASDIWLRRDWRIALDGTGWGITLVPGDRHEVIR
jgi:hypothetical protein